MDKLSQDELLLIFMKFKEDYEKKLLNYEKKINDLKYECNDLSLKCDSYEKFCYLETNFHLTEYHQCSICNHCIYKGIFSYDSDDENEDIQDEVLTDDYIECSLCEIKFCRLCYEDNIITIYQDNPLSDLFYCKGCYDDL